MQLDPKKLTPMPGYILVEPTKVEEKTTGGIYLPDSFSEKQPTATVLAVGGDWVTEHGATIKCPVKVGDDVLVKKWGGDEFKLSFGSKTEYKMIKFDDILAKLN